MKRVVLVLFVLLIAVSTATAKVYTKITLKSGSVVEGVLIEENNQIIRLELADRNVKILYKSDIASISTLQEIQTQRKYLSEGKWMQFIDLSYSYCSVTDFLGINYIGGYRFNPYLFFGLGTGVNIALFTPDTNKLNQTFCKPVTVNMPIYIHFKANFTKTNWSPYISVSAGGRITKSIYQEIDNYIIRYNQSGFLGDITLGIDRKISQTLSLYLGVGYKIESFLHIGGRSKLLHGFNLHVGVSF